MICSGFSAEAKCTVSDSNIVRTRLAGYSRPLDFEREVRHWHGAESSQPRMVHAEPWHPQ